MKVVAGIDVGKTRLDVSVSVGPVQGFDNTPTGLTALVGWLERHGVTDVVCEATGGYERALVRRVRHQAWSVHVAHPNRVRHFARAAGYQAKTDALDAQMLSRYGQAFELPNTVAQDADSEVLQDLLRRRKPLVDQRVQEHHRRDKGLTHGAHTSTQRHIQGLDKEIRTAGRGIPPGVGPKRRVVRVGGTLPERTRRRRVDRGHAGGVSAGVGTL